MTAQQLADKIELALRRASFIDRAAPTPTEPGALTVWMKDGTKAHRARSRARRMSGEQLTLAQAHSRTSRDAGRSIVGERVRLQTVVYLAIKQWTIIGTGLTDEEGTDQTRLSGSTYRPRRVELVREGRVRDSGRTRRTKSGRAAVVWEAVT